MIITKSLFKKLDISEQNELKKQVKILYCNELLYNVEIIKQLNINIQLCTFLIKDMQLILTNEQKIIKRKQLTNKIDYIKRNEKIKKTKLKRYNDKNYCNGKKISQSLKNRTTNEKEQSMEKAKKTKLEKYGDENYSNREKAKKTSLNKFGYEIPAKNKKIRKKISNTWQTKDDKIIDNIINKTKQTKLDKYKNEIFVNYNKAKQTKLKNYGNKNYNNREKANQTNLKQYGVESYSQKHIPIETLKILQDKELLKQQILSLGKYEDRTIYNLCKSLNLFTCTIARTICKHDLQELMNYTTFISSYEYALQDFLTKHNIPFISSTKCIIPPLELDIYIPEYNLAIEFNGTYWHSSKFKDKNYHVNKSKQCEDKGIRLIHIWEYEWNNERQRLILENIILNACHKSENKIFARKCKIEIRESKSMKDFFNKNNIQGFRGGKFSICLIYENEVIMAYQMGNAHFGKGKYDWEVIRGATKLGYTVIGGASKIWKYFVNNYKPESCVYYIDYNYFNGNSILNLDSNFKYIKTQSSFKNYWVNENIVKNREPMRHKEVKQAYETGECICLYNAGTKVYVYLAS